ncbi:hypothetical protein NRIC_18980 [Enterococcus florum]|uniref:Shikimate kinase n=1 Tax=Enterococcus florum TaxID=2480627 RepID=A0A4P5P7R7_9ENTE|nr:AAA family ATPase [Enterococcus florum]GCF94007.1 hypothetical protein NRIC_18980 [Enterococcus florum]
MGLIIIFGPQAVGKMTVGRALEARIDGRLLYNHQTLDLFASYLGYRKEAFRLSDAVRKSLFKAFVKDPEQNPTKHLIFTVVLDFSDKQDRRFLKDIVRIFQKARQKVYLVELFCSVEKRLERNRGEDRLAAKPSKRNVRASEKELLLSHQHCRLNSEPGEIERDFPKIPYLLIQNESLSVDKAAERILETFSFE